LTSQAVIEAAFISEGSATAKWFEIFAFAAVIFGEPAS
jgi:hypothetical protein